MGSPPVESAVSAHARNQGCVRPPPFTALCVACPVQKTCPVQRVSINLWTARIAMESGHAEPVFYFNDLATSPLTKKPRVLPMTGKTTYRQTAVEMRCGDLVKGTMDANDNLILTETVNLAEFLGLPVCQEHLIMDSRQVRYHHLSNYGRKATIAVQTCTKECAQVLSDAMNRRWHDVSRLVRRLRPLREMPSTKGI